MATKSFSDQMGNEISVSFPPRRIISLVPSQTELLSDLGLREEVVGITKFCVHPSAWRNEKSIVGGTKNIDLQKIRALEPDLIIGNKEENTLEDITALREEFPVWMSDIITLDGALAMIAGVGEITNRATVALACADGIRSAFERFPAGQGVIVNKRISVLYLIWRSPWMGAGANTFIGEMLNIIGWRNVLEANSRYPELTDSEIAALDPDVILLSSEPYPFREKHEGQLKSICPRARIIQADGEMFSWYGSRLLKAPDYFSSLIV